MSRAIKSIFYPFLIPNGLLTALVIYLALQKSLSTGVQQVLVVAPVAVATVAFLLGWRFNLTRLIYAIVLLVLVDFGLGYFAGGEYGVLAFQAAALLLPINLLLVSWLREKGMFNLYTIIWLAFLLTELLACGWLFHYHFTTLSIWINAPLLDLPPLPLSQPLVLANGLVLVILAVRGYATNAAFEISFFWSTLVVFVGLCGVGVQPLRYYLAGAGLILILGIMETSHALVYRDELTGLPGRRALNEALAKLGSRYTLAMLDIDHFKKFNDTHGHDVGDQVLKMVASKLATVSGGGKVFRYGGEEFSVVFPRKSKSAALQYLEQLRQAVEDARFVSRSKDRPKKKPRKPPAGKGRPAVTLRVTISIGAAERGGDLTTSALVIKAADRALYRAKKAGRNQVSA